MKQIVSNEDMALMVAREQKKNSVEVARQQATEAVAACMPKVLQRLMDLVDSADENVAFRACKALLDKHVPTPAPERVVGQGDVVDGEVVPEDVREIREKLEAEWQKGKG